jgi:hypothetical protein
VIIVFAQPLTLRPIERIRKMKKCVFYSLMAVFITGCSSSQGYESPEKLAQAFIIAINQKDPEKLRSLIHPECKKGLSRLEQKYLDLTIENSLNSEIPGNAKINIYEVKGWSPPLGDNMPRWPVTPTHQLSIDFSTGQYSSKSVGDYIMKDRGGWFFVWTFPSESTLRDIEM